MSIRPNAQHLKAGPWLATLLSLLLAAALCLPIPARGEEPIIVAVTLNEQRKGDFFVLMRGDGDFLLRRADLEGAGLRKLVGERMERGGEEHLSLRSLAGVGFTFDEDTLILRIIASPELLPKTAVDLRTPRRTGVLQPRDNSLFLNYGIDYAAGGESMAFEGLTVGNEFGLRRRDILLLTDTLYRQTPDHTRWVRLNSSLTWDHRESMRRLVAGDFFASSGDLGSSVHMAGLSFAKIYRIDPYFVRYPLFDFTGQSSLPAEVDLYIDGVRVRSERFAPGEFELRNFQSLGGAQTIEVVIRDTLGREQRILAPFYFTDQLLRRGLHEYSYNVGVRREDFGVESNRYRDLAFSGSHRYGVSDAINLGVRAEGGEELLNLGLESLVKAGGFGLLRLETAVSRDRDQSGTAALFGYEFQHRRFRARLGVQGFSEGYRTLGNSSASLRPKRNLRTGLGYVDPRYGSFSTDYSQTTAFNQTDRSALTFSWARRLWPDTYLSATLRQVREDGDRHEGSLNFTWYYDRRHALSTALRRERGTNSQQLEARRNTPAGEGTGWNIRGERSATDSVEQYRLNSSIHHHARLAALRGEFNLGRSERTGTEDLRLGVSGAILYIGDRLALTRPVHDSFALIRVGAVPGVEVKANGQSIGRTNARGEVLVPTLSSYFENRITINDKDIPIDFLMPRANLSVSPPLRSGSCFNFHLRRYQAFTGTLMLSGTAGAQSLAHAEVILSSPAGNVSFWTDALGAFYFDSGQADFSGVDHQGCLTMDTDTSSFLPPGTYPLSIRQEGKVALTRILEIPTVEAALVDLGEIVLPEPDMGEATRGGSFNQPLQQVVYP